jgi:hypothetical protein
MITIPAGIQAAIDSGAYSTKVLLEIGLDTPIYLTDHFTDIIYDSKTWDSSAHLGDVPPITDARLSKNSRITLDLSGVDQTYFSLFLSNDYINRDIKLMLAFIDDDNAIIDTPITVHAGRIIDVAMVADPKTGKASVSIIVGGPFDDFDKVAGRRTNTESQKANFATTDKGFDFTNQAAAANLKWGSK